MIWPPRHVVTGIGVMLIGAAMVAYGSGHNWRSVVVAVGGAIIFAGSSTFHGD
jgi:drug/metabolite transporter (DMT)-like permease